MTQFLVPHCCPTAPCALFPHSHTLSLCHSLNLSLCFSVSNTVSLFLSVWSIQPPWDKSRGNESRASSWLAREWKTEWRTVIRPEGLDGSPIRWHSQLNRALSPCVCCVCVSVTWDWAMLCSSAWIERELTSGLSGRPSSAAQRCRVLCCPALS